MPTRLEDAPGPKDPTQPPREAAGRGLVRPAAGTVSPDPLLGRLQSPPGARPPTTLAEGRGGD